MVCCEKCIRYNNCIKKWVLGEKDITQACCFECKQFSECLKINMKQRWIVVHGEEFFSAQ
jgi:hypothetical protein